jgi:DNA primase
MEHDSLGYVQALKFLADKFNIEWPKQEQVNIDEEKKQQSERESLQILYNWSADYFENILWNDSDGQIIGLGYFEERGFRHDIIKKFRLGYSKDSWNAYFDEAIKTSSIQKYYSVQASVKQNEDGKKYDAYRGRVIFPIHGNNGKVIAFAGRF